MHSCSDREALLREMAASRMLTQTANYTSLAVFALDTTKIPVVPL